MMDRIMQEPNLENCYFPSTVKRGKEKCDFDTVKVDHLFDLRDAHDGSSGQFSPKLLRALWALLLADYLGKKSVTFAVISNFPDPDALKIKPSIQIQSLRPQIFIYEFELSGAGRLDDLCERDCWEFSSDDLEGTQINTAVYISDWRQTSTQGVDAEDSLDFDDNAALFPDVFDLVLEVKLKPTSNLISLKYKSATISALYAQSVVKSLSFILQQAFSGNELELGPAMMIRSGEGETLKSWNPRNLYEQKNCMQYLVEAVVRSNPHAEAVCAWDGSLTYSQLDDLASLAAHRLGKSGVGPGVYVPFAFEKSMWTVVATLAILKAGGAFVPLDPNHPASRLDEIFASTKASLVVCSELFAPRFVDMGKRVVVISARTIQLEQSKAIGNFYFPVVRPTDPIFVLFTSGSTGKPKGMVHEHGAICTHAIAHGQEMGYHGARVLQFAAHTFDVAIIDIFTTLTFGGCVCIPSEEERQLDIVGAINKMKADYAIFTPSFARLIRPSDVPSLKTLAVGGEALPQDGLQEWLENVSLIQIYGPAEVGICLTINMDINTRSETVGFPLPNCSCWIVDVSDPYRLVPVGAVGELVVASPSLAREYLNDKARSQASFLENPPWAAHLGLAETRFFRTGDLLRYNTDSFDGSFDFVGRRDAQLKIRGQRVEPGEIEHHIATIPGVAISSVIRPDRGCFSGQLVAVVEMRSSVSSQVRIETLSLAPDQSISLEQLKSHLSTSLPIYMIPTVCLIIKSMPFVASLKIDRKVISAWLGDMSTAPLAIAEARMIELRSSELLSTEFTAIVISNKVAELVASTDCERRTALSNHDFNLQAAGLDSIQIISLSTFLQRFCGFKIPMNMLLDSTVSIRDLAKAVDGQNDLASDNALSRFDLRREYELSLQSLSNSLRVTSNSHLNGRLESESDLHRNIFVTGGTGYLGSRILQALLARPHTKVFAHIRCSEESLGVFRIIKSATEMGWWRDEYMSRLQVWCGDLGQKQLGLSLDHQNCLLGMSKDPSQHIHGIIHNGAKVHYSSHYESLRPVNVDSTITLLQITALSQSIAKLLFVSGGRNPDDTCTAEDLLGSRGNELNQASGYTQTKLVSELLVEECMGSIDFSSKELFITRPGYIIGTPELGVSNQTDFIWRLIAGCIEIGAYNEEECDHWLFIADANWVAERAVAPLVSNQGSLFSGTKSGRILDGLRFSELWAILKEDFGFALEAISAERWMNRLKAVVLDAKESHLLFPLLNALEMDGAAIGSLEEPLGLEIGSADRVKNAIRSNVRYLIRAGFLQQPPT